MTRKTKGENSFIESISFSRKPEYGDYLGVYTNLLAWLWENGYKSASIEERVGAYCAVRLYKRADTPASVAIQYKWRNNDKLQAPMSAFIQTGETKSLARKLQARFFPGTYFKPRPTTVVVYPDSDLIVVGIPNLKAPK